MAAVLRWHDVQFAVNKARWTTGKKDAEPTTLLDNNVGELISGQMLAIMGPSGAGKSTLLDVISGRTKASAGSIDWVHDDKNDRQRSRMSYVEQHDSLLGVLTVRETLYFSAKLSMPVGTPDKEVQERTEMVLRGLGLTSVADNTIGTPIKRGISGGQKRRVTIGCSLVSMPRVLFLDEPTSGLDIHTAYEVMSSISQFAKQYDIAVCATIHSPNWDIFALFSDVMLLAKGKTVYQGDVHGVISYMEDELQRPCPRHTNPADHMLRLVADVGFRQNDVEAAAADGQPWSIDELSDKWQSRRQKLQSPPLSEKELYHATPSPSARSGDAEWARLLHSTRILTVRNVYNYQRNLLAYGVRFAMYIGMGVLLATVWVNLAQTDSRINDRLSVHFFSVAFLGFMSVAGIPSFLEERAVMKRERFNGLYGPASFTLANTLVTMPFLFACALVFAVICYWSIGLHPGATYFFRWLAFLYIGILAAEMQSLLVAAIMPIFVAALAIAAFLNGFWMTTQGYFIRTINLPRFWYYWAHFINYETYAFALLVRTDFKNLEFDCVTPGQCAFPPSTTDPSKVSGEGVVKYLQFDETSFGGQAAILISIVIIYRLLFYVVLRLQRP